MKTHHGIIVMLKTSLIIIVAIFMLGYGMYSYSDANNNYWESVGPSWDRMLNPNKYSDEE
jgi:hypothetical protein